MRPANAAVELRMAGGGNCGLLGLLSVGQIIEAGHDPGAWSLAASYAHIVRRAIGGRGAAAAARGTLRGHQQPQQPATAPPAQRVGLRRWPPRPKDRLTTQDPPQVRPPLAAQKEGQTARRTRGLELPRNRKSNSRQSFERKRGRHD